MPIGITQGAKDGHIAPGKISVESDLAFAIGEVTPADRRDLGPDQRCQTFGQGQHFREGGKNGSHVGSSILNRVGWAVA
jgi:hypothetical protein